MAQGLMWARAQPASGRVLSLLLKIGTVRVNVLNIYALTALTERKTFFETLHNFSSPLITSSSGEIIIATIAS